MKGWDWYAFVQDDIRVTSRLTVNLGLRYQFFNQMMRHYVLVRQAQERDLV